MDWIILADLTVMKEFLVIQAIEHDEFYDYNTRTLRPQLFTYRVFPTATSFVVTQYLKNIYIYIIHTGIIIMLFI